MPSSRSRTAAPPQATMPWHEILTFLVLAGGGAWLVSLPLWLTDLALDSPAGVLLKLAMMLTPALAVLIVAWSHRLPDVPRWTGLTPVRPWGHLLRWCALAIAINLVIATLSVILGLLAGTRQLDLDGLSGLREIAGDFGVNSAGVPGPTLAATFLGVLLLSFVASLPLMFGEEWGWRGYLLPRLLPLGTWPALLLSGVIWGLWHAPVVLQGHNDGDAGALGVPVMTVSLVAAGIVVGWLRLASGSVWPAVVAHGSQDTLTQIVQYGLTGTDQPTNPLLASAPTLLVTVMVGVSLVAAGPRMGWRIARPTADRTASHGRDHADAGTRRPSGGDGRGPGNGSK